MNFRARDLKGIFARGTPDECPPNKLLEGTNIMSRGPNLVPRPGYENSNLPTNRPAQSHLSIFQPLPVSGVINPILISQSASLLFGFYPIYNTSFALPVPIYNALQSYHSWINFYGRGYFTPHDTLVGSQTEFVQVYEGGAASRNAAGVKPTSAMAGVISGTPGDLGVGIYLIDVSYVTVSGFITKPSGSVVQVSSFGSQSIDLTAIPTGPAGTAKRQIIATKAINLSTYTGNPNDYEFFLVPNALINDNVTTTHNLSFFDGNLVSTANNLLDLLETIPAGVGIGEFDTRMMVWGEYANNSIVRLSYPGEPESMSSTSGVIIVDPTESGGITNCVGFNGQLFISKGSRIFVATDNGGDPSTWQVDIFDAGIGTGIYGISRLIDSKGKHLNQFLIASRQGLFLFDGVVRTPELTFWIEDIWLDIDINRFQLTQVLLDPFHHHIYCLVARNNGVYQILVGDYSEGMNPDTIKWYIWEGPLGPNAVIYAICLQTNANNSVTFFLADNNFISKFNMDSLSGLDFGIAAFTGSIRSAPLITNEDSQIQQITEVRVRQQGGTSGDINARGVSADDVTKLTQAVVFPFITSPNIMQDEKCYLPFVDTQPTVKISMISTNRPKLSKVWVEGDEYGESKP